MVGRCRKKGSFRGAQERECAGLGELMQGRWMRMSRERDGGNEGMGELLKKKVEVGRGKRQAVKVKRGES